MRLVRNRVIREVHGLRRGCIDRAHQVLVNLLAHERNHGSRRLCECDQRRVERHIGIDLVLLHALCPEAVPAAAHVPVRHVFDKFLEHGSRLRNSVVREVLIRVADHAVHLREQPLVHDRELLVVERILGRIEVIDVRVEHVKRIGIPERSEELSLPLAHSLLREFLREPRCRSGVEIPANRIRAEGFERLHRIDRIALRLGHLIAVLIEHKAQDNDILKCRLVKEEGRLRMQGVEPASGLIDRLGDEGSRELLL